MSSAAGAGPWRAEDGFVPHGAGHTPSHSGTLVYFSVKDIDAALERVKESGCRVIRGKMDIGQFGYVGHFEDSEGNRVALHQGK